MTAHYWAVRPKAQPEIIRIEKASNAKDACHLAFGRGVSPNTWEAKDLGTNVSVIQSDNKRIALLKDPNDWVTI
jgi:hypothetical protein